MGTAHIRRLHAKRTVQSVSWRLRRWLAVIAIVIIAGCAAWPVWTLVRPLPPITISPETTLITEPRTPFGLLDYESVLHATLQSELKPNSEQLLLILASPDGQSRLSSADRLDGYSLDDRTGGSWNSVLRVVPWKAIDWPFGQELIGQSEVWLGKLRKYKELGPEQEPYHQWDFSLSAGELRDVRLRAADRIRLIQIQATLHFGNGRWEHGFEYLRMLEWLMHELYMQDVPYLNAWDLHDQIGDALFCAVSFTDVPSTDVCRMVDELQPIEVNMVSHLRRKRLRRLSHVYDSYQGHHQLNLGTKFFWETGKAGTPAAEWEDYRRRFAANLRDWDACFRRVHERYDELDTFADIGIWEEIVAELTVRGSPADLEIIKAGVSLDRIPWRPRRTVFGDSLRESLEQVLMEDVLELALPFRRIAQVRMTKIAVRLECWRRRFGSYPEKLSELCRYPATLIHRWELDDPFSGSEFFYAPTGSTFDLRSAGPDCVFCPSSSDRPTGPGYLLDCGDDIVFENPIRKSYWP
ncbi:MAG: hypothetical protein JNL58_11335 [Planctomyces sp.]|nr:hypothetical protein [Planctomyces sp.]